MKKIEQIAKRDSKALKKLEKKEVKYLGAKVDLLYSQQEQVYKEFHN